MCRLPKARHACLTTGNYCEQMTSSTHSHRELVHHLHSSSSFSVAESFGRLATFIRLSSCRLSTLFLSLNYYLNETNIPRHLIANSRIKYKSNSKDNSIRIQNFKCIRTTPSFNYHNSFER